MQLGEFDGLGYLVKNPFMALLLGWVPASDYNVARLRVRGGSRSACALLAMRGGSAQPGPGGHDWVGSPPRQRRSGPRVQGWWVQPRSCLWLGRLPSGSRWWARCWRCAGGRAQSVPGLAFGLATVSAGWSAASSKMCPARPRGFKVGGPCRGFFRGSACRPRVRGVRVLGLLLVASILAEFAGCRRYGPEARAAAGGAGAEEEQALSQCGGGW